MSSAPILEKALKEQLSGITSKGKWARVILLDSKISMVVAIKRRVC